MSEPESPQRDVLEESTDFTSWRDFLCTAVTRLDVEPLLPDAHLTSSFQNFAAASGLHGGRPRTTGGAAGPDRTLGGRVAAPAPPAAPPLNGGAP
jgi:hypothetical protein